MTLTVCASSGIENMSDDKNNHRVESNPVGFLPLGSILRDIISLLTSRVAILVINSVAAIFLIRHIGPEMQGIYAFALIVGTFYFVLSDFGLYPTYLREIKQQPEHSAQLFGSHLMLQAISSSLILGATLAITFLIRSDGFAANVVLLVLFAFFFISLSQPLKAMLGVRQEMYLIAIMEAGMSAAGLALVLVTVILGQDILFYLVGFLIAAVVISGGAYPLLRSRLPRPRFARNRELSLQNLRYAFPLALVTSIQLLLRNADIFLLTGMRGFLEVGLYSVAYKFITPMYLVPLLVMNALFPTLAERAGRSLSELAVPLQKSIAYLLAVALPIAVLGSLLGSQLTAGLFGPEFAASGSALALLVWAALLVFASTPIGHMLMILNKGTAMLLLNAVALVVNLGLNFLLIPRWGYLGASGVAVTTQLVIFVAYYWYFSRYSVATRLLPNLVRPALASVGMAVFIGYGVSWMAPVIAAVLGCLVYLALLTLSGFWKAEDRRIVLGLVGIKPRGESVIVGRG
jgi:O-antigen/teichoic acid export membrane protein